MDARPITFLSDYGHEDEFAGVCRAVIFRIAPEARVIDLTHGIPRQDVRRGALALAHAVPHAPPGIHLAVVDPGVGTERRAVAVRAGDDRVLVGPDNGLLVPAAQELGGARAAVDLSRSPFRLDPVSATFHGRDVFAPVAARLALGASLDEAGIPIDPDTLLGFDLPRPRVETDGVVAHVLSIDGFGNAALNLGTDLLERASLRPGHEVEVKSGDVRMGATFGRTFSDVAPGELLLYEDSTGTLALSVNLGSAAESLSLTPDNEVLLRPAR